MKIFWKVRRFYFYSFIRYIDSKYKNFDNTTKIREFISYYNISKYDTLYLCVDSVNMNSINMDVEHFYLSYCSCSDYNYDTLINDNWRYKGEFNDRKEKLDRLNKLSDD